eukprot:6211172-Pleurochrysis_carterae.AAC.1
MLEAAQRKKVTVTAHNAGQATDKCPEAKPVPARAATSPCKVFRLLTESVSVLHRSVKMPVIAIEAGHSIVKYSGKSVLGRTTTSSQFLDMSAACWCCSIASDMR